MAISGLWKKLTQGAKAFSAIAALSLSTAACSSDDTKTIPCQTDAQCEFGTVCQDALCVELPCGTVVDCLNGRQDCITLNDARVCAAVECGCIDCAPCPTGEQCSNGVCTGTSSCSDSTQCNGTDVCDNGSCRPCQGSECGADTCVTTGCPTGQTCNTTSGQCEQGSVGSPCDTCTASSVEQDCGAGWACSPLRTGFACLPPCTTGDDCETGWTCSSGSCRPVTGACEGCTVSGCPTGQTCNATSNQCEAAKPTCGSCSADWECGADAACLNGSCQARCDGATCSDGAACVANNNGVKACNSECVSECTPACTGSTSICRNGTCVQCNADSDCSNGQICNVADGTCIGQVQCQAPTPINLNGNCVECATNADCGDGFCNAQTNTCTSSRCGSCVAPYPGCLEIDGDAYCVQCTEDSHCGTGGTCKLDSYSCQGGIINPVGDCRQVGCQNSSVTSFNLACDQATGLCYDQGGYCDDITAFCPTSTGQIQRCVSMLDAMMGGGMGMDGLVPPGTIPGFCGCSSLLPGMGMLIHDCKVSGAVCGDLASFMSGGPSTNPVCWALGDLFGGGTP